ncbi:hypothetical protein HX109_10590 [Galbibacter sp. BG1]|uniref:BfmA/BtgA family mobilization protein n=1 Tax=Galbibacter sp. BG1 TaxID=1170699 RepID=UPI0015BC2725|nr:BfmA/BtgA family mobilization protein [Galbibacter sp. BG1]QLE01977.1 hypothetical protein HX109_10590 [Galbibacter sp. BG1]
MDKGYEKERFVTVKIKEPVVRKFRKYCRQLGYSQSMTLLIMLEFFEGSGLSPKEKMDPKIQTLESLLKKRINHVIAIIREQENTQTKPTMAMLQALFEEAALKQAPRFVERNPEKKPPKFVEKNKDMDEF